MNSWTLFAFGSAAFAALTAIFAKIGVSTINSNLATFIRTVIIVGISAAVVTWRSEWMNFKEISGKTYLFLALSAVATGLSWLCYYRAIQLGPVSKVAILDKLSVVLVVIFSVLFLKETLTLKLALGTLMIAFGILLCFSP